MSLSQIRGLKFPDEFLIRFFFKNKLHNRTGRVLELGCGNGCNLMLFHEYGWTVTGLDISRESLSDAEHNFALVNPTATQYIFAQHDLARGLGDAVTGTFDVLLLPSVLYYIPRRAAVSVLQKLRTHVKPGTLVYLRNRSLRDYRYRRGEEVERNGFRLTETVTGEAGVLNVFYDEWELMDMLQEHLQLDKSTAEVLLLEYQNPQQGVRVSNAEIVIWGQLGS